MAGNDQEGGFTPHNRGAVYVSATSDCRWGSTGDDGPVKGVDGLRLCRTTLNSVKRAKTELGWLMREGRY